jgi:hypothetical protein
VFWTNAFANDTIARIIDSEFYQQATVSDMTTGRGLAAVGDQLELYFTANKKSTVSIWIIDDQSCPSHSLWVVASGGFRFSLDPRERFGSVCVFGDGRGFVDFGFSDRSGDAYLLTPKERMDCNNEICRRSVSGPYCVAFVNGGGEIRVEGSNGGFGSDECWWGPVGYANVSHYRDGGFKSPKATISCDDSPRDVPNSRRGRGQIRGQSPRPTAGGNRGEEKEPGSPNEPEQKGRRGRSKGPEKKVVAGLAPKSGRDFTETVMFVLVLAITVAVIYLVWTGRKENPQEDPKPAQPEEQENGAEEGAPAEAKEDRAPRPRPDDGEAPPVHRAVLKPKM